MSAQPGTDTISISQNLSMRQNPFKVKDRQLPAFRSSEEKHRNKEISK
jgi:hypothetical protein